ncbi:extracellular serine/threonine protein CG31145 [Aphidius gifuensis]|nr:extracellular serine/threonine protein CG31145 [Aphidius gifuensis]
MKPFLRMIRIKEKLIFAFSAFAILFTVLLVMDLQMDLGYSGHHLVPSHGRVKMNDDQYRDTVYNNFRRRFKYRANTSKEILSTNFILSSTQNANNNNELSDSDNKNKGDNNDKKKLHDEFFDLINVVMNDDGIDTDSGVVRNSGEDYNDNLSIGEMLGITERINSTTLEKFHLQISRLELYPDNSNNVQQLLHEMATKQILHVAQKEGGTQLKLVIDYPNDLQALFKPMRFGRDRQTLPNHFYFTDFERHVAEIATYHLDKLLGFRRAPPVTGRILNMTTEIYQVAEGDLLKTFFVSPAGNMCFHGRCSYVLCGYNISKKASIRLDSNYCNFIREIPPYDDGRRLLDLIDMSVLDFLSGNMDRHHYETLKIYGNNTFPLHLDHGRGFGKPYHDETSILAPLLQCCIIRQSTLRTLLKYHNNQPQRLSSAMRQSMAKDPVTPVLWEPHLTALDRRVGIILQAVRDCLNHSNQQNDNSIQDIFKLKEKT